MFEIYSTQSLLLVFSLSVMLTLTILFTKKHHLYLTGDTYYGPQKIHDGEIPRIGGLVIFLCLVISAILFETSSSILIFLALAAFPSFISGFCEDLTKNISVSIRLLSSIFVGIFFLIFFDTTITDYGFSFANNISNIYFVGSILTCLAIASLTQAFNIIDGLNGLSIGTSVIILSTLSYLSLIYNKSLIFEVSMIITIILCGLLVFNFPKARIFVGDSGAYLMGSLIAMLSILFSESQNIVSPFCLLLIIWFPLYELVRSFIRRLINFKSSPFKPDNRHLHSIIYNFFIDEIAITNVKSNAISSIIIMIFPVLSCLLAIIYAKKQIVLICLIFIFILLYELVYILLIKKFKFLRN